MLGAFQFDREGNIHLQEGTIHPQKYITKVVVYPQDPCLVYYIFTYISLLFMTNANIYIYIIPYFLFWQMQIYYVDPGIGKSNPSNSIYFLRFLLRVLITTLLSASGLLRHRVTWNPSSSTTTPAPVNEVAKLRQKPGYAGLGRWSCFPQDPCDDCIYTDICLKCLW